ncbi:MAG: substrate-binding domain-containing protein [Firmicutes bacterium]|nr:substrate-binding domain-containing protein [Bacillota bacterium]
MARFKGLLPYLLVFGLLLGLTGMVFAEGEKLVIGTSIITYEHPFYIDVVKGMKRVAERAGVEMLLNDPKGELANQVQALETYIGRRVDALIVYGVDPSGVVPVVEEATKRGIPVITADMQLYTDKVVTFIGSDNLEIGRKLGEYTKNYIAKNMGGKAKIGVVSWLESVAQQQRLQGFKEKVTELPGVRIVTVQQGKMRDIAMASTENIITAHPDINMIMGTNQVTCMAAVAALEMANRRDIKVVGVDIDTEIMRAIKEGKLLATVAQQPLLLGEASMQAAIIKAAGKKLIGSDFVPNRIVIPTLLVSKENLKQAEAQLEIQKY